MEYDVKTHFKCEVCRSVAPRAWVDRKLNGAKRIGNAMVCSASCETKYTKMLANPVNHGVPKYKTPFKHQQFSVIVDFDEEPIMLPQRKFHGVPIRHD